MSKPKDPKNSHSDDQRSTRSGPEVRVDQEGSLEADLDELENSYREIFDQAEEIHRADYAAGRRMAESVARPSSTPEQPPDMIDQAVQNMARRAVEAPDGSSRRRGLWMGGFATFSLAVIALSLILQQDPGQDLDIAPVDGLSVKRDRAPAESSADDLDPASRQLFDSTAPDSANESAATAGFEERSTMKQSSEPESISAENQRVDRLSEARQERSAAKSASLPAEEDSLRARREADRDEAISPTASQPPDQANNESQENFSVRSFGDQPAVDREDPESWLDYISQLKAAGRTADSRQEFRDFRQVFPDYPLPDEFSSWD